jgi:LmbE family N-acetylglucosaminyl deacetylase
MPKVLMFQEIEVKLMKKTTLALILIFEIILIGAVFSYEYINTDHSINAKTSYNKVVIFTPHPDDETIGMGGLIAKLKSEGKEVHVVLMCSGNGVGNDLSSYYKVHILSNATPADRKKDIREDAFVRVMNIYGISYEIIGLDDGGTTEKNIFKVMERMYYDGYGEFYTTTEDYNVDHQHCADAMKLLMEKYPQLKYRQFPIYWHAADNGPERYVPAPIINNYTDYNVSEYLPKKQEALQVYCNIQLFPVERYQTNIERIYYLN